MIHFFSFFFVTISSVKKKINNILSIRKLLSFFLSFFMVDRWSKEKRKKCFYEWFINYRRDRTSTTSRRRHIIERATSFLCKGRNTETVYRKRCRRSLKRTLTFPSFTTPSKEYENLWYVLDGSTKAILFMRSTLLLRIVSYLQY